MQGYLHSMTDEERSLALAVLSSAFARLPPGSDGPGILACIQATASLLPLEHGFVTDEYAQHVAEAAVWYLDRATRRLGDPDREVADLHQPLARRRFWARAYTNLSVANASGV